MSGIAVLPGNDIGPSFIWSVYLEKYNELPIYELTKMTFEQYIGLSREDMKELNEYALTTKRRRDAEEASKAAQQASIERQLATAANNINKGPSPGANNPRNIISNMS